MEKRIIFRRNLKTDEIEKKKIIRGYPVVFEEITDRAGYYKEKISRNALDGVDLSETVLIVGHNFDNLLAKSGVNMRLEVDETGLFFEAELGDTEYDKLIYDRVKRGILDGMSFGFSVDAMETNFETKTDTITKVGKLYEITLTPIPAYPQTVATAFERDIAHQTELNADLEKQKELEKQAEIDKLAKELEEL